MKPEISPLRCVQAFVSELSVKANLDFDPRKPISVSYEKLDIESAVFDQNEEGDPTQVTLKISQDAVAMGNVPYSFSVEMVGFFQAKGVKKEDSNRFIYIHGSSVLYGMARGALNDTMSKGPYVSISLPLVSFYRKAERTKKIKAPAKKAAKKTAKKTAKKPISKSKK